MDTKELRTLQLLEEIESEQAPSQRDLATRLNISLGLVNSFMKRLTKKGYFKITNIPRNRVKYILTPKGAAEKTRLTYEYIQYSFQFFKDARRKMKIIFQQLEKEGLTKVVFWGTGEIAEIAYLSLQETRIQLIGVVDDEHHGEKFMGLPIIRTSDLANINFDLVLITAMAAKDYYLEPLQKAGVPRNRIRLISP